MKQSVRKESLLHELERVEHLANTSKFGRLINNPLKYLFAIGHRSLVYPITKTDRFVKRKSFFGHYLHLTLPASVDIFLTGGKSHPSELRLAKYLIKNLSEGQVFMDIGAHIGYFSLLASVLVGDGGTVYAFEPTGGTHQLLAENVKSTPCIEVYQKAVYNTVGFQKFYEFPPIYAEYNSFDIDQFKGESWFGNSGVEVITVDTTNLDDFIKENRKKPDIIKIDVEGSEDKVIDGGSAFLQSFGPKIIMEFLSSDRKNAPHTRAASLLNEWDYKAYTINYKGELDLCYDITEHLDFLGLDSDNIVFIKA